MPVPTGQLDRGRRQLLRDMVYEKLLGAIEEGMLVPGERLSDEELTRWLGVSRTPVREAVARLEAEGLIEMEANRYTRVAPLSTSVYQYASEFLHGLHALALTWRLEDDSTQENIRTLAGTCGSLVVSRSMDDLRQVLDLFGELVAAGGNSLFMDAERRARGLVKHHAADAAASIDWERYEKSRSVLATGGSESTYYF